MFCAWSFRACR